VGAAGLLGGNSSKKLPGVRAVELSDPDRGDERRIEVPKVDTMLRTNLGFHWLPVRDATAGSATDCLQRSVALYVLGGVLRVPFDGDSAELEVDPRTANSPAKRTVAVGRHGWRRWQRQLDQTAVAGTLMHWGLLSNSAGNQPVALAARLNVRAETGDAAGRAARPAQHRQRRWPGGVACRSASARARG